MENETDKSQLAKKMAHEVFEKYDLDNSSYIERDEAKVLIFDILKKHKVRKINVSEEEIDKYFKTADLNRDGKISLEEAEVFFRGRLFDLNQSYIEKS